MSQETDQIYQRVNDAWDGRGKQVPPLRVAAKAVRALWKLALSRKLEIEIVQTSGNRTSGLARRAGKRVFAVNCDSGWAEIVHHLSHEAHIRRPVPSGERRHHGPSHALLELKLVRAVMAAGWLDEQLAEAKPKPDVRVQRAARVEALIGQWEAKQRRAENALKKLYRKQRYYARQNAAA